MASVLQVDYEDIYSMFLGYIEDNQLAGLSSSNAYDLMNEWLLKAYSDPYVRRLFSSSAADDDAETLTFEMKNPTDDQADIDFTIDVLAKGMVIQWLTPQVRSKVNIAQMFGGKEQKFYSQQAHLSELRSLLEDVEYDQRRIIRDRGYINNSYLEET